MLALASGLYPLLKVILTGPLRVVQVLVFLLLNNLKLTLLDRLVVLRGVQTVRQCLWGGMRVVLFSVGDGANPI
jgi:hypothetical protein